MTSSTGDVVLGREGCQWLFLLETSFRSDHYWISHTSTDTKLESPLYDLKLLISPLIVVCSVLGLWNRWSPSRGGNVSRFKRVPVAVPHEKHKGVNTIFHPSPGPVTFSPSIQSVIGTPYGDGRRGPILMEVVSEIPGHPETGK